MVQHVKFDLDFILQYIQQGSLWYVGYKHIQGVSERSELTPCTIYITYQLSKQWACLLRCLPVPIILVQRSPLKQKWGSSSCPRRSSSDGLDIILQCVVFFSVILFLRSLKALVYARLRECVLECTYMYRICSIRSHYLFHG